MSIPANPFLINFVDLFLVVWSEDEPEISRRKDRSVGRMNYRSSSIIIFSFFSTTIRVWALLQL
jgi:hypothetical protein